MVDISVGKKIQPNSAEEDADHAESFDRFTLSFARRPQPPPVGHSQTPLDLPTAKAVVLQIGDLVQDDFFTAIW